MSRRLLLGFIVWSAACGGTPPAAPTPTVASPAPTTSTRSFPLEGEWRGIFEVVSCSGTASECRTPRLNDYVLRLTMDGALRGVLILTTSRDRVVVDLDNGVRSPAGEYTFTTSAFSHEGYELETAAVPVFTLREDGAGFAGTVSYSRNGRLYQVDRSVVFRTAERVEHLLGPGPVNGEWSGIYVLRSCEGTCAPPNASGYAARATDRVSLSVIQSGAAVTVAMMSSQLTGQIVGSTLTADGPDLTADQCQVCWDCGGPCQTRARNLRVTTDALGRMNGTFDYLVKGVTGSNGHFRYTVHAELIGVVRIK